MNYRLPQAHVIKRTIDKHRLRGAALNRIKVEKNRKEAKDTVEQSPKH